MAKDLRLFERWHERGDIPLTHKELAQLVSCDALLLRQSRFISSGNEDLLSRMKFVPVQITNRPLQNVSSAIWLQTIC